MRESPASRDFPFPAWSCPESILHAKTSGSTNHAKSLRPEESLSFSKRAHQPLSLSSSADAVQCGKVAGRAILLLRALSLGAPAARRDCSRSAGTCGPPARLQRRRTVAHVYVDDRSVRPRQTAPSISGAGYGRFRLIRIIGALRKRFRAVRSSTKQMIIAGRRKTEAFSRSSRPRRSASCREGDASQPEYTTWYR
jgi:hypothetical protein